MTKFIIHHNMGKNWSFFYKTQHERMLQNLGQSATLDFTDNTLIINVKTVEKVIRSSRLLQAQNKI